jgi:ATP-dependent DNA helicase RecG
VPGIEIQGITEAQRDKLLAANEGHFLDFKATAIAPAKLTESLSAFANSDGGELYIGVAEGPAGSKLWRGFADPEAANGHIQALEMLFPLGRDFGYAFLAAPGSTGLILQIQVLKTREIKRAADGHPYIRRGAQKLQVRTAEMIRRLEYTKGLASFETELVNADPTVVSNSVVTIEFMLEVIPTTEPELWLKKQQLIRESRPSVAGVLLFAEEPQAIVPKHCGVKLYRYKTKDKAGARETLAFDPITIEGHVYAQIDRSVSETVRIVEEMALLGESGMERVKYPREALHEIITNAIIHRDYSLADDVHIRVFDNRIEVESPGKLPAHITVANILNERFARNGSVVRLLNKFPSPPNKDVGEGLNTAFSAMHKLGLKEPKIEEKENSVLVTIRHETLASPAVVILEYLEAHDTIRNKTARELTHIAGDYVVKEIFRKLEDRQLIERVPGTRTGSTAYQKGRRFSEWRKAEGADPKDS